MDDPPRGTAPTQLSQADPAAPAELAVGSDRLIAGRYEVLERIGGGAMGAVFRVRDRTLDEVVALKVLHGELQRSPDMQERFRQEVKLARRVTHANVARTYDIGQHEGTWFLTMELVEGESLAQLIERRAPLPCEEALAIASQVCAGLVAAHEAGVIHRDLKPENIRLGPGGRVVLLDFGIARQHLPEGGRSTLGMLGTPAYMAPEQVSGAEQIDERADIYAFGTVLFELSTGKLAWPGSSPFAVANARLSSPPPDPRATGAEVDPGLAALVSRCLARDPAQRFASARELGVALERLRATQPVTDPVPAASRSAPASGAGDRFVRKHGVEALDEDLAKQLRLMGDRSPPYRRVLELLRELLIAPEGAGLMAALSKTWQKRSFDGPYERPLLLLAALRFDAMAEGASHPLFGAVASDAPSATACSRAALLAALAPDRLGFWVTLRTRRVQTNEVSRALAWLWPAALAGCGEGRRPLAIVDVGASAGLNLSADLLSLSWRKRAGGSLSAASSFELRARVGFDPRPLDAGRTEDRAWLRACVWPGQLDRLRRLDAAIGAFQRATPAPEITLLRAASVPHRLPALSERVGSGGLVLVYQTLVRGYLPSEEREVYEGAMLAWLQQGRRGERAWVTLELEDEHDPELNCPIDVQVATGGASESIRLGCTGYHPEVVDVDAKAEQRLVELLRV